MSAALADQGALKDATYTTAGIVLWATVLSGMLMHRVLWETTQRPQKPALYPVPPHSVSSYVVSGLHHGVVYTVALSNWSPGYSLFFPFKLCYMHRIPSSSSERLDDVPLHIS